jgi:hypothetical protein
MVEPANEKLPLNLLTPDTVYITCRRRSGFKMVLQPSIIVKFGLIGALLHMILDLNGCNY